MVLDFCLSLEFLWRANFIGTEFGGGGKRGHGGRGARPSVQTGNSLGRRGRRAWEEYPRRPSEFPVAPRVAEPEKLPLHF